MNLKKHVPTHPKKQQLIVQVGDDSFNLGEQAFHAGEAFSKYNTNMVMDSSKSSIGKNILKTFNQKPTMNMGTKEFRTLIKKSADILGPKELRSLVNKTTKIMNGKEIRHLLNRTTETMSSRDIKILVNMISKKKS